MPRRRPPVDIYTTPVPNGLSSAAATCPICGGPGDAFGFVVEKLVFRCRDCGIRFKALPAGAPGAIDRNDERP